MLQYSSTVKLQYSRTQALQYSSTEVHRHCSTAVQQYCKTVVQQYRGCYLTPKLCPRTWSLASRPQVLRQGRIVHVDIRLGRAISRTILTIESRDPSPDLMLNALLASPRPESFSPSHARYR